MKVSLKSTPLEMRDINALLTGAFERLVGADMGEARPYLLALMAMENNHGKSLYNNNWGNVTIWSPRKLESSHGPALDYFKFKDSSKYEFQSFPSQQAGAEHFVRTLLRPQHKRIIEAALDNDFNAFFDGIATPHKPGPSGRMYCDTCYSQKAKDNYRDMVVMYGGVDVPNSLRIPPTRGYRPRGLSTEGRPSNTSIPNREPNPASSSAAALLLLVSLLAVGGSLAFKHSPRFRAFYS